MPDPLVGRRFYDFVVERKLAEGGMGAVYLLRHERYPIRKVLKVIRPEYANHPAIRERFEREAHAVASLKSPYITEIDSVGTIEGQPCMLIPFLEGQPLDAYLPARGGRLPAHEALHIAMQIARGLHYAHGKKIIHRDLKPGNVFVVPTDDDRQAIQVLDFGIAKQLNTSNPGSSGTISGPLGTPEYMAVEQFEHAADVTPAADVWALAIMIWEMLTGRRPWTAPDTHVLYHKQLTEPPEPPTPGTLLPAWESILRKALCPNPRLRPQSMPELVVPLALSLPANPPDEPSGVEVAQRTAQKWLDEYGRPASTRPLSAPPPMVPAWTPGVVLAPQQEITPHHAEPATTLGSSAGVLTSAGFVTSRSRTSTRRKRALLGAAAAVLFAAVILAIATVGSRDHNEPAARTQVESNASGSAYAEPPATTLPIAPSPSEAAPNAARPQLGAGQNQRTSAVPDRSVDSPAPPEHVPLADDVSHTSVAPDPTTSSPKPARILPGASRATLSVHPPGGTARGRSGTLSSKATTSTTATPAPSSPTVTDTPAAPKRAKTPHSPASGQGSDQDSDQDFDPNAVAGKREK